MPKKIRRRPARGPTRTELETLLRSQAGREYLRARTEGHGRPIVTTLWQGRRVVAVNDRFHVGDWKLFTDFLMFHMWWLINSKDSTTLGQESPQHPLVRWQQQMAEMWRTRADPSSPFQGSSEPFVAALIRLAYALYLIAHNDQLPRTLIPRLRNPLFFRAAVLETYVAAAFTMAGFKLEMRELEAASEPEPEFTATSPTGKSYSVEAKRKDHWDATPANLDVDAEKELATFVRRKLRDCAAKRLPSPIYWLELSMPGALTMKDVFAAFEKARQTIRDTENTIRIDGTVPAPAYVVVSNFGFLADGGANTTVLFFDGFHIKVVDFDGTNLDEALEDRDRHRDVRLILKRAREIQAVPHSFEGLPDALLDKALNPIDRFRVGERLHVTLNTGDETGIVKLVLPGRESAGVVLIRDDGSEVLVKVALTADEQRAAKVLGASAFGQPERAFDVPADDPLAIYDFFLEALRDATKEQLLAHHLDGGEAGEGVALDELRRHAAKTQARRVLLCKSALRPNAAEATIARSAS